MMDETAENNNNDIAVGEDLPSSIMSGDNAYGTDTAADVIDSEVNGATIPLLVNDESNVNNNGGDDGNNGGIVLYRLGLDGTSIQWRAILPSLSSPPSPPSLKSSFNVNTSTNREQV